MTSKKGFIPIILVAVLALVVSVGGVGIGLAWRTEVLDKWLPANVKEFLGKEITPTDGEQPADGKPEVTNGEEPSEEPSKPAEDKTKDWETYTNGDYGYYIKYAPDWWFEDITKQVSGTSSATLSFIGFYLAGHGEDTVHMLR